MFISKLNRLVAIMLVFSMVSFSLLMFAKTSFATSAAKLTPEDLYNWNKKYKDTKPQMKVGDIITYDKKELLEPFVNPAIQPLWFHEDMAYDIGGLPDTNNYSPPPIFWETTEKFRGQSKIGEKGEILGYVAGMPFTHDEIKLDDPQAGFKLAWDREMFWKSLGSDGWLESEVPGSHIDFIFVAPGEHKQSFGYPPEMFKGGSYKRYMKWVYKKIRMRHLHDRPPTYQLDLPEADEVRWKELISFYEPYDVKGVTQLTVRYDDAFKADDAWMYIPSMRRVRRLSTGQRADALLGSELTLDDYFGFSGKICNWDWKYLGDKVHAGYLNANLDKYTDGKPHGCAPSHGNLEIRDTYCLELVARYDHPYSRKIMWVDKETMRHFAFAAFDRAGKLWKTYTTPWIFSDDPKYEGLSMHGKRTCVINGSCLCYDHQKDRGTICPIFGYHKTWAWTNEQIQEWFSLDYLRKLGR